MADRKATFAKRQRETELKDRAREKEARRVARRASPQDGQKGPPIAWDDAVHVTTSAPVDPNAVSLNPTDDSASSTPAPPPPDPTPVQTNRPNAPRPTDRPSAASIPTAIPTARPSDPPK